MKFLCLFIIFSMVVSMGTLAEDPSVNGVNVKTKFEQISQKIQKGSWPSKAELQKKYVVLFAPGFLSNSFTETFLEYCMKQDLPSWIKDSLQYLPDAIKNLRLGDYYHDQIQFLREQGIEAYFLKYESEAGPEENAFDILQQILDRTGKKKAIVVSHSKGGVDTGVALCGWIQIQYGFKTATEDLTLKELKFIDKARRLLTVNGKVLSMKDRVYGWLAVQSAFRGSPVADEVVNSPAGFPQLAYALLEFLGGNQKSLLSLVQAEREQWIQSHMEPLQKVVQSIPVLSISTYKKNPDGIYSLKDAIFKFKLSKYFDTFLAPVRNSMHKNGYFSDGLVPWQNAIIDGSDYLLFDSMDHAAPVMDNLVSNIDRIHLLKTALQMLLEK